MKKPVGAAYQPGANHLLHLVLTLLTCGLWLPVWFLVALSSPPRVLVVDEDGNVRRPPVNPVEAWLKVGFFVLIVVFIWWAGYR